MELTPEEKTKRLEEWQARTRERTIETAERVAREQVDQILNLVTTLRAEINDLRIDVQNLTQSHEDAKNTNGHAGLMAACTKQILEEVKKLTYIANEEAWAALLEKCRKRDDPWPK